MKGFKNSILVIVLNLALFTFCKNESIDEKVFENKVKKDLEDAAFILNCNFNITELKLNKIEKMRLDSVYRECYFERFLQLERRYAKTDREKYFSETNSDANLAKWLELKQNADLTKHGQMVYYYVTVVFINRQNNQTNILYQSLIAYFDDKENLLFNQLYFDNWDFAKQ